MRYFGIKEEGNVWPIMSGICLFKYHKNDRVSGIYFIYKQEVFLGVRWNRMHDQWPIYYIGKTKINEA